MNQLRLLHLRCNYWTNSLPTDTITTSSCHMRCTELPLPCDSFLCAPGRVVHTAMDLSSASGAAASQREDEATVSAPETTSNDAMMTQVESTERLVDDGVHNAAATSASETVEKVTVPPLGVKAEEMSIRSDSVGGAVETAKCVICLESYARQYCRKLGVCEHRYCVSCISGFAKFLVSQERWPLLCASTECKALLDVDECIARLDGEPSAGDALVRLVLRNLEGKKLVSCAGATCTALLERRSGGHVSCKQCGCVTCCMCSLPSHPGTSCAAHAASFTDEHMKELVRRHRWQTCPSCAVVVERVAGCNIMRCRCGARFCYNCGMYMPTRSPRRCKCRPSGMARVVNRLRVQRNTLAARRAASRSTLPLGDIDVCQVIAASSTCTPGDTPAAAATAASSGSRVEKEGEFTCAACKGVYHVAANRRIGSCAHRQCNKCLVNYLKRAVQDGQMPIPCMQPKCGVLLDPNECILRLSDHPSTVGKLVLFVCNSA